MATPPQSRGCALGEFVAGATITLTAAPAADWHVASWTGTTNDASTAETNTVTMPDATYAASVTYAQDCHALTLEHTGNGADPVAAPSASQSCAAGEYLAGELITLTADPDDDWHVASWVGTNNDASTAETNTVTMPAAAYTASVIYEQDCHALNLAYTGMGARPSATPFLSPGCSKGQYLAGSPIQLTADPAPSWHVAGWTGTANDASTSTNNSLIMPASDHTVSVIYEQDCYALNLAYTGMGARPSATPFLSPGCSIGQYRAGTPIQLTAAPAPSWHVAGWTGTNDDASTSATISLTMPAADHTATVHYEQTIVRITGGNVDFGNSIMAPVDMENVLPPGVGAVTFEVRYDPAIVTPSACVADPNNSFDLAQCNMTYDNDGINPDSVRVTLVSTGGVAGTERLAEITFDAIGAPGSISPLDVVVTTFSDPGGAPVTVTGIDDAITIGQITTDSGDVNCDGNVNVTDAMFILQYDLGMITASEQCPPPPGTLYVDNCDVSGNNVCDAVDALFILQCDLNMPNPFCPIAAAAQALEPAWSPQQNALLGVDVHVLFPDGQVTIPVHAEILSSNLGAATVELRFDPQVLQPIACVADPAHGFDLALCNKDFDNDGIGTDAIRLNALSSTGLTGGALLAEITFQAISPDGSASILELIADTFANTGGNPLDLSIYDGKAFVYSQRLYLPAQR